MYSINPIIVTDAINPTGPAKAVARPTIAPSAAPNIKLTFALEASLLLDAPAK